mmetsp:Transcript_6229/g.10816  ORF Transcript_6229/g.10816 Transcript_6229/m.10816 type:complete len:87 (+) Transcript_6229:83-343(+)
MESTDRSAHKVSRTYYHSKSGEPFIPEEDVIDSEIEVDHSWLRQLQNKEIDDLRCVRGGSAVYEALERPSPFPQIRMRHRHPRNLP